MKSCVTKGTNREPSSRGIGNDKHNSENLRLLSTLVFQRLQSESFVSSLLYCRRRDLLPQRLRIASAAFRYKVLAPPKTTYLQCIERWDRISLGRCVYQLEIAWKRMLRRPRTSQCEQKKYFETMRSWLILRKVSSPQISISVVSRLIHFRCHISFVVSASFH